MSPKDDGHGNASASTALDADDDDDDDDAHLGGHAMVLVGYDDTEQQFIVRNSQGASWGANGYGFVPFSYVLNPLLARDFWVVDGDADAEAEKVGDRAEAHTMASDEDTRGDKGDQAGDQANTDDDTVPPLFRALLDRVGV